MSFRQLIVDSGQLTGNGELRIDNGELRIGVMKLCRGEICSPLEVLVEVGGSCE